MSETANGLTFVDQSEARAGVVRANRFRLMEVTRHHEPVSGDLSVTPGGDTAAFHPDQKLAYNATVAVNVQ